MLRSSTQWNNNIHHPRIVCAFMTISCSFYAFCYSFFRVDSVYDHCTMFLTCSRLENSWGRSLLGRRSTWVWTISSLLRTHFLRKLAVLSLEKECKYIRVSSSQPVCLPPAMAETISVPTTVKIITYLSWNNLLIACELWCELPTLMAATDDLESKYCPWRLTAWAYSIVCSHVHWFCGNQCLASDCMLIDNNCKACIYVT